jgi:hypothetical protein
MLLLHLERGVVELEEDARLEEPHGVGIDARLRHVDVDRDLAAGRHALDDEPRRRRLLGVGRCRGRFGLLLVRAGDGELRAALGLDHRDALRTRRELLLDHDRAAAARQRVVEGEALVARERTRPRRRIERAVEAQLVALADEAFGLDAERDLEVVGAGGQREPVERRRLRAIRGRHVGRARAAILEAHQLGDAHAAARPGELELRVDRDDLARVGARLADAHRDALLCLARREADPVPRIRDARVARADQIRGRRIVRDTLEDEVPGRVGARAAQPGRSARRQRVEEQLDVPDLRRRVGVHDRPDDARRAGGHVGDVRFVAVVLRASHRGEGEQGDEDPRGEAPHVASGSARTRRSACGHSTSSAPAMNVKPPIQIQLTSGLRWILSVAEPSGSSAVRIT